MEKKAKRYFDLKVHFWIRKEDASRIRDLQRNSTCHTTSDYLRSVILQKPVGVYYRNKSADELLLAMNRVKNNLTAIHHMFGQLLQQCYQGNQKPGSEDRFSQLDELGHLLDQRIEEIRLLLVKNYDLCSQSCTGPAT